MTTDPQTARYRHRTTEAEAVQWTGTNADALRTFAGPDFDEIELDDRVDDPDETAAVREAEHGTWRGLKPGDWVVKLDGGLYEFSAADFAKQYEAVSSAVAQPAETVLRDRIAALFRHPPGAERLGDATPGEIADAVLAVLPAASAALCICGHTEQQHFEDACITEVTGCDCGDYLTPEAAREVIGRWQAALRGRADRASACICGQTPNPGICPFEHDGYKAGGHCTCAHPPVGRDESHRLAERQIRDAARGLFFDVGARVIAVLDDDARRLAIRARQGDSGSVELPDPKFKENAETLNLPAAPAVSSVGQAAHTTRSADLLRRTEAYLSALHGSVARHDNLAANLGCAGCELRDQVNAELCRMADEERTP